MVPKNKNTHGQSKGQSSPEQGGVSVHFESPLRCCSKSATTDERRREKKTWGTLCHCEPTPATTEPLKLPLDEDEFIVTKTLNPHRRKFKFGGSQMKSNINENGQNVDSYDTCAIR